MLIQLASTLALVLGGIYGLYCLSRAASGMERLAAAVERLVAERAIPNMQMPEARTASGVSPSSSVSPSAGGVSPGAAYPPAAPQPFVPHVPVADISPEASATTVTTPTNTAVSPTPAPPATPAVPSTRHKYTNDCAIRRNDKRHVPIVMSTQNTRNVLLAPSLLSADWWNVAADVEELTKAGCEWLHFDAMDGHFVPNLTMGPMYLRALRPHSKLHFDAHLMLDNAGDYINDFLQAGADSISVHVEGNPHLHRVIYRIKDGGAQAGVVINIPELQWRRLMPYCRM
jgi:hypothetical protein